MQRKLRKLLVVITFGILPVIFMGSLLMFSIDHLKAFNWLLVRDLEVQQEQCKDWHENDFIAHESSRTGFVENGEGVRLTNFRQDFGESLDTRHKRSSCSKSLK